MNSSSQSNLILPPRYTEDSIALWSHAVQLGWHVERLPNWRVPDSLQQLEGEVCVYGEPLFTGHVASALGLTLLEPRLDWLTRLPVAFTKRTICALPMGEARTWKERAFFKPADDKSFDAKVYESGADLPSSEDFPDDLPTLISEPVGWKTEFRCFLKDRKVEGISPYCRDGEICDEGNGNFAFVDEREKEHALGFVHSLLCDGSVELPPAVVVDVGEMEGRGWGVIEANPAWASGIYGCDPNGVLNVIRRACVRNSGLTADDQAGAWRAPRGAEN